MQHGGGPKWVRVVRALASGGGTTLATSWALGKLLQQGVVIEPSRRLYEYSRLHRSAALARRLDPVTTIGGYSVVGTFSLLVGAMLAYERRRWTPLSLLVGGVVAEAYLQKSLKRLVKGTTPCAEWSLGPPGDYPSGGAARTVITFGLLGYFLTRRWNQKAELRVIWTVVALLVVLQGSSRLYLGRHWPEDVVGGWLLGGLVLRTLVKVDKLLPDDARS